MIDWKPIETAPKDGTELLGYLPQSQSRFNDTACVIWWEDSPYWSDENGSWQTIWGLFPEDATPTHWAEYRRPVNVEA